MTDIAVDVWMWSLAVTADEAAELAHVLSEDERARAKRFLSPGDRDRFIAGRARLRHILSTYTSVPAATLRLGAGNSGKPFIEGEHAPHFNLSHSGDRAALAVCADHPVGIDIEAIRPIREQIAERYFSPDEVRALSALPGADQVAGFFRCWTRKEAVVKARGGGLSIPLDSFTVSVKSERNPQMLHVDGASREEIACWKLFDFEPGPEMAGAVAVKARHSDVRLSINCREKAPSS